MDPAHSARHPHCAAAVLASYKRADEPYQTDKPEEVKAMSLLPLDADKPDSRWNQFFRTADGLPPAIPCLAPATLQPGREVRYAHAHGRSTT